MPRSDLRNHPRAEHATAVRRGVITFGYAAADDHTLVTLATGLGGLPELGIEIDPTKGHSGSEVVRAALTLVPRDEVAGGVRPRQRPSACGPVRRFRPGGLRAAVETTASVTSGAPLRPWVARPPGAVRAVPIGRVATS